ncbi:MAG: class I SAM-dependent methyltransferase [Acidimicrobiia bacterium]
MAQPNDTGAFDRFEAEGWERVADGYAAFWPAVTAHAAPALLDAAGVGPGTVVLDVATGPGVVAGRAAARGAVVTAVDLSASMLETGRRAWPDVDFRRADAYGLPFDDGAFEAVVVNFGILHIGDPERVVTEARRVLGPGGRLAMTVWDQPGSSALFGLVRAALADVGAAPPPGIPVGPDFFRFSDDAEFEALLSAGGFGQREVGTVTFTVRVPRAEDMWVGIVGGTVRSGALIAGLPPDMRDAVRAAFDRRSEAYEDDGALLLPFSVKLAVGVAPA